MIIDQRILEKVASLLLALQLLAGLQLMGLSMPLSAAVFGASYLGSQPLWRRLLSARIPFPSSASSR